MAAPDEAQYTYNVPAQDITQTPLTVAVDFNRADLTFESVNGGDVLAADIRSIWDVSLDQPAPDRIELTTDGLPFQHFLFDLYGQADDRWTIGLGETTPINLELTGDATASLLDLRDVTLNSLLVDVDTGAFQLYLPETVDRYNVDIQTGPDASVIRVPDDAAVALTIDATLSATILDIGRDVDMTLNAEGGFGGLSIAVPESAAVRVETEGATLNVPPYFIEQADGTWQTSDFADADNQIVITYAGGPGALEIR